MSVNPRSGRMERQDGCFISGILTKLTARRFVESDAEAERGSTSRAVASERRPVTRSSFATRGATELRPRSPARCVERARTISCVFVRAELLRVIDPRSDSAYSRAVMCGRALGPTVTIRGVQARSDQRTGRDLGRPGRNVGLNRSCILGFGLGVCGRVCVKFKSNQSSQSFTISGTLLQLEMRLVVPRMTISTHRS